MNLQYWRDLQKISRRVACEVLKLVDYDIKIHHLKGSANGHADALSRWSDFDQEERDNEGVVVLPDTLFVQLARPGSKEKQDKGVINSCVDLHQLKKIDGVWQKDVRVVVTTKSPYTKQLIHNHHDLPIHSHPGISLSRSSPHKTYFKETQQRRSWAWPVWWAAIPCHTRTHSLAGEAGRQLAVKCWADMQETCDQSRDVPLGCRMYLA